MDTLYKLPLVLEPQPEGGYTVTCPLLPEWITEGDTVPDALEHVGDALAAIIEAYEDLGWPIGGSHRNWFNPATGRIAPLPDWGNADLKLGTVRAVVRQLGLEWDGFKEA